MSFRTFSACVAVSLALFGTKPIHCQMGVEAILPNGRQIRPVGNWIPVAPYPFAIALKPDGSEAAVPSIGFPFALNVINHPDSAAPSVKRFPGMDAEDNDPAIEAHAGLAYSPDGGVLYVATGDSGKVTLYSTGDWHQLASIPLDAKIGDVAYTRSFAATVLVSADGRTLYALDQGNWRVVVIDLAARQVIASVSTGADPFGMAISPDGKRLYITNIGLFEYSTILELIGRMCWVPACTSHPSGTPPKKLAKERLPKDARSRD